MDPERFVSGLINYERVAGYAYDLEPFRRFLARVGSPHRRLRNVIHIAGTKGKGSTAAMLASCLQAHGWRVGLYTSPHVRSLRERIQIDGQLLSTRELERYLRRIKPFLAREPRVGARTYFEVLTAIAMLRFAEADLDFTILEVGLGGRLDATNVCYPCVSVITRVGIDHTNLLGNTLGRIAFEKAGIIKPGGTLVTIHQRPETERVLTRACARAGARITYGDDWHRVRVGRMTVDGMDLAVSGHLGTFRLRTPLVGRHQVENLLIALAVMSHIRARGWPISPAALGRGLASCQPAGRFQVLARRPLIVFDVAHNEDSFLALARLVRELRIKRLTLIFGCSADKDISAALDHLFPLAHEIVLVRGSVPRALDPARIALLAPRRRTVIAGSTGDAVDYLQGRIDPGSAVLITGSFYLWDDRLRELCR